jgi:hypothetical protein
LIFYINFLLRILNYIFEKHKKSIKFLALSGSTNFSDIGFMHIDACKKLQILHLNNEIGHISEHSLNRIFSLSEIRYMWYDESTYPTHSIDFVAILKNSKTHNISNLGLIGLSFNFNEISSDLPTW